MSLKDTYIQYGVPSNWAKDYEERGIAANTFKNTTQKQLSTIYNIPADQVKFVKKCLVRQAIEEEIVQELLEKSNFVCCLCKESKLNGYIIHHIKEYSKSSDNNYQNLAVLCPNHHDLAHKTGLSLTNKITAKQITDAKKTWERKVKEFNSKSAGKKTKIEEWKKTNPYPELLSFTENDKDNFFGRSEEIESLIIKIYKYNIVGLFGESGTGKTSLINAGIIPKIKDENIVVSVRCYNEPIKRIRESLFRILRENDFSSINLDQLAEIDSFPNLIIKLKTLLKDKSKNIIIVIDQFEEIFTRARADEKELLARGIIEAIDYKAASAKILFLLSLREDFIGEMWDWTHKNNLDVAWINQYRISRLNTEKANDAIIKPLKRLQIKYDDVFISLILEELKKIGDGLIYPPYLQIVCSELFEIYKSKNQEIKPSIEFNKDLLSKTDTIESIIADYLNDSMLNGLTLDDKLNATNALDLLTGAEGLRAFLTLDEISRFLNISEEISKNILEHLISKKVVHAIVEDDVVKGYELVHDFLSKKFFEKMDPKAKSAKTVFEMFNMAYKEWKKHGVLASEDRLKIFYENIKQLNPNEDEWTFIIKSSFSVYYSFNNDWIKITDEKILLKICLSILNGNKQKNINEISKAIYAIGEIKNAIVVPTLIKVIESKEFSNENRDRAIGRFYFDLSDLRVIKVLKNIIKTEKSFTLRKSSVYALARNLKIISETNKNIINKEIDIFFLALNDSLTSVRKEAADVLGYTLKNEKAIKPLIERLKIEQSIKSKKAIISSLYYYIENQGFKAEIIKELTKISKSKTDDFRVKEEAKRILQYSKN